MIREFFDISEELLALDEKVRAACAPIFAEIERTRDYNQM